MRWSSVWVEGIGEGEVQLTLLALAAGSADSVLAECESIAFAPNAASDARLDTALIERAKKVAEV